MANERVLGSAEGRSEPDRRPSRVKVAGVAGALAGAVLTVATGVTTEQINQSIEQRRLDATAQGACNATNLGTPREGEDFIQVGLRTPSEACWVQTLNSVSPGDQFSVRLEYKNFTGIQQDNVSLRAILPVGYKYIAGTTEVANSTTKGKWTHTLDGIATRGFNAGSYQASGNVFIKFDVVMSQDAGPFCGVNAWAVGVKATTQAKPDGSFASAGLIRVEPACDQ